MTIPCFSVTTTVESSQAFSVKAFCGVSRDAPGPRDPKHIDRAE